MSAFAAWLGAVTTPMRAIIERTEDSRLIWLPMDLALTFDQYDDQTEVDSLIGRVVGHPFTDRNALTYMRSTDLPLEVQLAELVREQALRLTKDEVPHAITVEVQEMGERVIEADVLVETESQKQIVVGGGGAMIKAIGTKARPEIEALLGRHVFLELQVKVRPRWRRDEAMLERLGL